MDPEIVDAITDPDAPPLEEQVVMRLADSGLSPEIISYSVGLPITRVRSLIVKRRPGPVPLIDEKLAEDVRKLAAAALREAHTFLEFGTTETKLTIIKSMLSGLSRHVTTSSSSEAEEARVEFEAMLVEMRTDGIPERDRVVTDDDIIDVKATDASASPFAESLNDQD